MNIGEILNENGPMLSGELARLYQEINGVSNDAARQAISRAKRPVVKYFGSMFKNKQKFVYLDNQYMNEKFVENFMKALRKEAKAYYSIVNALITNLGFLNKSYVAAYSAFPVEKLKGHKLISIAIQDLVRYKIIDCSDEEDIQLNNLFMDNYDYKKYKAIQFTTELVVNNFFEWARKINLISYNDGKMLYDTPIFTKFQWCFSTPSYTQGIRRGEKQGTIVADVILGKVIEDDDLEFFFSKISIINAMKNHINYVPFFIADSYSQEAFKRLKANGVVAMTLRNWLGEEYEVALKNLIILINNASAIISKSPDDFLKYFKSISKIEGKTANMKGKLFELAVGFHCSLECRYIELNKPIYNSISKKRNEIDVYVENNTEVRIIECKGYTSKIDVKYVQKWITETIVNIRESILGSIPNNKRIVFELWSTGGFDDEALTLLRNATSSTKKYDIKYLNKAEIEKKAKQENDQTLLEVIQQYF